MVINAAVKSENKIITVKSSVQPASGSRNPRTFMGMIGGNNSIQMVGLGSIFQAGEKNSMVEESLEEYALDFT